MQTALPGAQLGIAELQEMPTPVRNAYVISINTSHSAEGFCTLMEAYLLLHGRRGSRISPLTLNTYRVALRHFVAWVRRRKYDILTLSRDQAALYARDLEQERRSPSTVAVHLAAARNLYAALRWSESLNASPFQDVHHATDSTPDHEKRDPYEHEDIERLIDQLWDSGDVDNLLLVLLCSHAGMRIHEAINLRWIDIHGKTAKVRGKGGKLRTITLSKRTLEGLALMRVHQSTRKQREYILPWRSPNGARRQLRLACQASGVSYMGAHSMRHYCGTRLYSERLDLLLVARHLGHSDVNTSARYTKVTEKNTHPVSDW